MPCRACSPTTACSQTCGVTRWSGSGAPGRRTPTGCGGFWWTESVATTRTAEPLDSAAAPDRAGDSRAQSARRSAQLVGATVFVVLLGSLLIRNSSMLTTGLIEYGDASANSILIDRA